MEDQKDQFKGEPKKKTIFIALFLVLVILSLSKYRQNHTTNNLVNDIKSQISQQQLGTTNDIYQPYKLEGFGKGWVTSPEFDGTDMPDDALVEAVNIDFGTKKSIAPRQGTIILGTISTTQSPIKSLHTSKSLKSRELLIRTYGTVIEWWNPINSTWEDLDTGYTSGKIFTFADGNNSSETENYTYFSNGVEALKRFRVVFGSVASNTGTTLTLNAITGFSSAADAGFKTSGTIRVNGTNYTYSGLSGWQLTGLVSVPALTANLGVISAVETTGFTDSPASATSIIIKDQRLYAAYKNNVYCSRIDDLQNFSFSSPRVASEGEIAFFPDGGASINALGIRPTYVAVFKNDYIGSLQFKDFGTDLADIPVISTIAKGIQIGATNPNAVTTEGFSVMFSKGDIGLTELTRLENKDYDESINVTEPLRPTLESYNFTNGAIVSYNNYILTSAENNGEFNNEVVVYDRLHKRLTLWEGINANAFTTYGNNVYYGDAVNNNVYQIFYSDYNDNTLPYSTSWKTKWYNFGEPTRWKEVGWVFVEGFINKNTTLTFKVNLDEGGDLTSKSITITGTGSYVSTSTATTNSEYSFGDNPFGLFPFSSDIKSDSNLIHFVGYISTSDITQNKFRNIQFEGSTNGTGQDYRISRIIPYYKLLEESYGRSYPSYIINY